MSMPWAKFFWTDYAADPQLKLCSFAAQGLWMRMLCIAAEHEPAGYVAINGRGLDPIGICRITGGALAEVEGLLVELEQNGVYSRDRRGWIYSRRMINDAKMRRKASEAGKKGGNPRLRKDTENQPPLKGEVKGEDNQPPKPQKPEARYSVDKSTGGEPPAIGSGDIVKDLFDLGLSVLTSAGVPEKQARSLIGKWRKGGKDAEVLLALMECRTKLVSNPVEWLTKRLKPAAYVSSSGYEYRGGPEAVMKQAEKRSDWDTYWQCSVDLKRMKEAN